MTTDDRVHVAKAELLAFLNAWRERNDLRCSEIVSITTSSLIHLCPKQWGDELHRLADEIVQFRDTSAKLDDVLKNRS